MEDLLRGHRQQKKELQARITHKKKSATKKTRKNVNDECVRLERELEARQADEVQRLNGHSQTQGEQDLATIPNETLAVSDDQESPIKENGSTGKAPNPFSAPVSEPNQAAKKPNRQKQRLARRAAQQVAAVEEAEIEASKLPDLREHEMQRMHAASARLGRIERSIPSDGHCLYAAFADQLNDTGMDLRPADELPPGKDAKQGYAVVRRVAAACIERSPNDFAPFLELPLAEHARIVRETGEWGGHIELAALAKAYRVDINILHADGQVDKIESGSSSTNGPLWLAYYLHNYGLGEHYNSLRQKP